MSRHSAEYLSYSERKKFKYKIFFLFKLIIFFFIIYHCITFFLFSTYSVQNVSMEPLLKEGDYIVTAQILYGSRIPFTKKSRFPGFLQPQRGDVVVALPGNYSEPSTVFKIIDPIIRFFTLQKIAVISSTPDSGTTPYMVKRIVGIPGDTIRMEDFTIYIKTTESDYFLSESELIERDYTIKRYPLPEGWEKDFPFSSGVPEIELKDNEYYIIGDNRSNSHDSRHFGSVPLSHIITKVVFRYWPLKHFGVPQ